MWQYRVPRWMDRFSGRDRAVGLLEWKKATRMCFNEEKVGYEGGKLLTDERMRG